MFGALKFLRTPTPGMQACRKKASLGEGNFLPGGESGEPGNKELTESEHFMCQMTKRLLTNRNLLLPICFGRCGVAMYQTRVVGVSRKRAPMLGLEACGIKRKVRKGACRKRRDNFRVKDASNDGARAGAAA
jgi:hypothetical protein